MKTSLRHIREVILSLGLLFIILFSSEAKETRTVYEQLCILNKEWGKNQIANPLLSTHAEFESHEDLIQAHLRLVIQTLRSTDVSHLSAEALKRRLDNLDRLRNYANASIFPQNLYHQELTPYFIDDFGTACAVGYLIVETGNESLAETVRRENNYAFISELNNKYPALKDWADYNGFTIDELAWIQPMYCPGNPCAPGTQMNANCGMNDGCANPPTPTGGVPPYTYMWGLMVEPGCLYAGTYGCTVTDAIDTLQIYTYVIQNMSALAVSTSGDDTICFETSTVLTATASGNVDSAEFTWLHDGSMGATITVSPTATTDYKVAVSDGFCTNDTSSFRVNVENCTGIHGQRRGPELLVIPNPSNGSFAISLGEHSEETVSLEVYSYDGKLVYERKDLSADDGILEQINLINEAKGVYMIRLIGSKTRFHKKIILN